MAESNNPFGKSDYLRERQRLLFCSKAYPLRQQGVEFQRRPRPVSRVKNFASMMHKEAMELGSRIAS